MKRYHLAPVILVVFILFAIVNYQADAMDFKIYTGYPTWRGFAQVDSCGFHGLRAISFSPEDLQNNPMGLELFPLLGGGGQNKEEERWLKGCSFLFEAEGRDRFDHEMRGFSFFRNEELDSVVGSDEDDSRASNNWARHGDRRFYNEGYLVRGLRDKLDTNYVKPDTLEADYAYLPATWFYKQIFINSTTKYTNYYAVFWLRGKSLPEDDEGELRLKIIAYSGGRRGTLKDTTIQVSDLPTSSYDSLLVRFHKQYDTTNTDPSQWDTTWANTDIRVWWNGNDDVWVDRIDVYDEYAWNTLAGDYDSEVASFINDRYSDPNVKGFKLADEPRPWQMNVNRYWPNYLKDTYEDSFYVETSWAKAFNFYLDYWFADNLPVDWFRTSEYRVNSVKTDTSSDHCGGGTVRTLQGAMDSVLAYIDNMRVYTDGEKPLLYNTATGEYYAWNTGKLALRRPTQWEQEAMVWLPVAHGVNLGSYWDYNSYYMDCNDPPSPSWVCPEDTSAPWIINWEGHKWVAYHRGLVYQDPDQDDWLYRRDPRHVEPNWSVVRRVNKQLRALGDIISDTSSWQAGFTCDSLGSWVSSFKSDRYTDDKAYVEIATFEHSSIDYLLLVNRRCLSTEGQYVRVGLDLPGSQYYITTLEYFEEGDSAAFTDLTYSGKLNGEIPLSTYLEPGQGKFLKITPARRKI